MNHIEKITNKIYEARQNLGGDHYCHFIADELKQFSTQETERISQLLADKTKECEKLRDKQDMLIELVNIQAEDKGLWFKAEHITESYLQEKLRYLHRAIEREL